MTRPATLDRDTDDLTYQECNDELAWMATAPKAELCAALHCDLRELWRYYEHRDERLVERMEELS